MTFGEVVHYVTQPAGWPEPVRGIASLLSSFHCPDRPSNENFSSASSSTTSDPLASHETPAPEFYTARDFQILIHSTAAGLSALAKLPHYGSKRSTVPLWSQLVHALANTFSPDVVILEEAPFIMPRAQNVPYQPSNLIDGHATLLVAHAIFSEPRTHSDRAGTNTRNEEDQDESICSASQDGSISSANQDESISSADQDESISSADQDELICFADQDESICSADSDSCDGVVDSLDLPLQALMLPGRGRCLSAEVPVLLVADPYNIIPLLCSALYQRHVWGIRHPVVGLCCSRTGTIATAIFGWLESDQSEEGRMPRAHLALAADVRSDPLMGVFDFTDTSSATSLAQFVLGLRTHFEDIKGATSIEAVDSLTPLHWRSDVYDSETQFWGQSDERVASWTRQVYVQTCASDVPSSSSSTPRTPSPLLDTVPVYETMSRKPPSIAVEGEEVDIGLQDSGTTNARGSGKRSKSGSSVASSAFSNSQFAAQADGGLSDAPSISNWLLERKAFTVGRIPVDSEELANKTGINTMVKIYDRMTAFTWSDKIKEILSQATVDDSLACLRQELCNAIGDLNCQSSEIDESSLEKDIGFISDRLSALLHAVENARGCDDNAKSRGVNEAERRHEWDSLLFGFTKPIKVEDQQVVLLERKLNLARNFAVDDSSFVENAMKVTRNYQDLCQAQHDCLNINTESPLFQQSLVARDQAIQFSDVTRRRSENKEFYKEMIQTHSSRDPVVAICDAILIIPISSGATSFIYSSDKPKKLSNNILTYTTSINTQLTRNFRLPYSRAMKSKGRGKGSQSLSLEDSSQPQSEVASLRALSNSQFAARSATGVPDEESISFNWLLERYAYTIGRIKIKCEETANNTKINAMVDLYDQMTAFTWSDEIKMILSKATVDGSLVAIREELCDAIGDLNCQSSEINVPSLEMDIKFISSQLSALLHAVKGALSCDDIAKSRGANEAGRRHQWDSLLLNFFEPATSRRDVSLERQLNLARNLAADDSSSATKALEAVAEYHLLCNAQANALPKPPTGKFAIERTLQARAARDRARGFSDLLSGRSLDVSQAAIMAHSSRDPVTGICDAILAIPSSGGATAMLPPISSSGEHPKHFTLVQDPKPEKLDASMGENSHQIEKTVGHSRKTTSNKSLQVPSSSRISDSKTAKQNLLQHLLLYDPDGNPATQKKETMPSENTSGTDILLPVLLAEYKKKDASAISTAMNLMRMYQVSAATFLSALGITDQPVFGLVVNGTVGAITMAWKTNDQIYVMERNVQHYDIRDPLQALQFVSILRRLASYGVKLHTELLKGRLAISDVKWSKFHQREEDKQRQKEEEEAEKKKQN